jgi:predicted kinase
MKIPNLLVPIGIPGCGKSSLATSLFPDAFVVSTDEIREELHPGVEFDASRNSEVFDLYHDRIASHLTAGVSVYADATNLQGFARERLIDIADSSVYAELHYIVFTNKDQAVRRNTERDRVVPPEAMLRMVEQYEKMLTDIVSEPYDSITYIEKTA